MTIEYWLASFSESWTKHDINKVLSLFTENVEYWETPHKLLRSFDELKLTWKGVSKQRDIELHTEIFSSINNSHAVRWDLKYLDERGELQRWSGTYLIKLNTEGKCTYFHHTGEKNM